MDITGPTVSETLFLAPLWFGWIVKVFDVGINSKTQNALIGYMKIGTGTMLDSTIYKIV